MRPDTARHKRQFARISLAQYPFPTQFFKRIRADEFRQMLFDICPRLLRQAAFERPAVESHNVSPKYYTLLIHYGQFEFEVNHESPKDDQGQGNTSSFYANR